MASPCTIFRVACVSMAIAVSSFPGSARSTVTMTAAARDSILSPDGNGRFSVYSDYGEPCINDAGQVAFAARLTGTALGSADNDVIVRTSSGGIVQLFARQGGAIPDGPGSWADLQQVTRQYAINDAGRVVFNVPLT